MKRTTILAEERLLAEVAALARRRGVTTSHAIREALERYVSDDQSHEQEVPSLVGMFAWEGEPVGERAEEILERDWASELADPADQPDTDRGR